MRLGSYEVASIIASRVATGTNQVNVGTNNVRFGEFRLDNGASERDVSVRTVTLRNDGSANVDSSLSNLALWSNGQKVSSSFEMNGRDVIFMLNTPIAN